MRWRYEEEVDKVSHLIKERLALGDQHELVSHSLFLSALAGEDYAHVAVAIECLHPRALHQRLVLGLVALPCTPCTGIGTCGISEVETQRGRTARWISSEATEQVDIARRQPSRWTPREGNEGMHRVRWP